MNKPGERTRARVLVVDDEPSARSGLEKLLKQEGYGVATADRGETAIAQFDDTSSNPPFDVVVTDLKMPGMDGVELMRRLRSHNRELPVIVVTAFGDVSSAVGAMRAGASDYLTKPVDFDALLLAIDRCLERRDLRAEAEGLRSQLRERDGVGLSGLVGTSSAMQKIYRIAHQVAAARATVLITGESGTGKGELARAIHQKGPRSNAPFVAVHCAALAESLLESELFGHEKGSFTGAEKRRLGRFEQAHGGTIFLDEIGEIPQAMQVKLLRVLQERTFERVGGNEPLTADVRIIAATNRDLAADVEAGRFREDLFYRLNVIHLEMPPLRAREGDVLLLARHFLQRFSEMNHKRIEGFSDGARGKLLSSRWPGNVRELENAVERAVVLCEGVEIGVEDLPVNTVPAGKLTGLRVPGSTMAEIERFAIVTTLEAVGGSTVKAAEMLEISVRTIQYRLHEYSAAKDRAT